MFYNYKFRRIIVGILAIISLGCLLTSCRYAPDRTKKEYINAKYSINHYIDTINGHIILTTVCDNNNISVSTLELNK